MFIGIPIFYRRFFVGNNPRNTALRELVAAVVAERYAGAVRGPLSLLLAIDDEKA